MNWKINYWTVLFVFVLTGWVVASCVESEVEPVKKQAMDTSISLAQSCDSLILDTITWDEGVARMVAYWAYTDLLEKEIQKDSATSNFPLGKLITNVGVKYFHLPRCELNEMLKRRPDGDIYAVLSLEVDPKNEGKERIDLLFSDQIPPTSDSPEATEDDDDAVFFDFTRPCPTSCPE